MTEIKFNSTKQINCTFIFYNNVWGNQNIIISSFHKIYKYNYSEFRHLYSGPRSVKKNCN